MIRRPMTASQSSPRPPCTPYKAALLPDWCSPLPAEQIVHVSEDTCQVKHHPDSVLLFSSLDRAIVLSHLPLLQTALRWSRSYHGYFGKGTL